MGWLNGWQYRKSHEVEGVGSELTNYQIKIILNYGSGIDSGEEVFLEGKCRTDFGDVRFADDDGETLIDYWIEEIGEGVIASVTRLNDLSANCVDSGGLAGPIGGKFYLFDGVSSMSPDVYSQRTWEYNPDLDTWNTGLTALGIDRLGFVAVYCPNDGKIYTFGGKNSGGYLDRTDCYDPSGNSWSSKAAMPAARYGLRALWVPEDERIHIVGGTDSGGQNRTHWTYNPDNNTWDETPADMAEGKERHGHFMFTIDGDIYVFCGYNGSAMIDGLKWDSGTNTWSNLDNAPSACYGVGGYATNLVYDGKAYRIGGMNGGFHSSIEEYNPDGDTWTAVGSLIEARDGHVHGIDVTNGIIYVVGGKGNSGETLLVEKITFGFAATFWVEVPDIPITPSNKTIYVYYGNASETTISNGKNTFINFYEFNSDESGDWTEDIGTWLWDTGNSRLKSSGTGENRIRITGEAMPLLRAIRIRGMFVNTGNNYMGSMFAYQDTNNFYLHRGRIDNGTKIHFLSKKKDGNWTNPYFDNYSWDTSHYYVLEAQWIAADKIKLLIDDDLKVTQTSSLEAWTTGGIGLRSYHESGDIAYYDFVLVRQCIDVEPVNGAWGGEEEETVTKPFSGSIVPLLQVLDMI